MGEPAKVRAVSDSSSPPSMPFFARLWFAYVVFFRVLFNGAYAADLQAPKALPAPETKQA